MSTEIPRALVKVRYYAAAQEYLRKLPLEHFMEATAQATQREITLESLALLRARRPDVKVFNELLVQYPLPRRKRPGQVVPDNMVVIYDKTIEADGSYDLPLQPVGPFWVLEYVSKSSRRKDYDDNMRKYEHELKVPYYLLFVPDEQELTLYRHTGEKYVSVPPDDEGRCALPQLELSIGLQDGWLRFWFRGEILPLPADLQNDLDETRAELAKATQRADAETRRADTETRRAETESQRAETEARRADAEQKIRLEAERELADLRAQLDEMRKKPARQEEPN